MKRVFIYAHYDVNGSIQEYVLYCLKQLRPLASKIVFVTTAALQVSEKAKLKSVADEILEIENKGYDFYSWKTGILSQQRQNGELDELILLNSSVIGPLFPLEEAFAKMDQSSCDLWGMTESFEFCHHVQSYFLCFKRNVLKSPAFEKYWQDLKPFPERQEVINRYELPLAMHFKKQGFRVGSYIKGWKIRLLFLKKLRLNFKRNANPTIFYPVQLLQLRMPFVKIQVLRDNPFELDFNEIFLDFPMVKQLYNYKEIGSAVRVGATS